MRRRDVGRGRRLRPAERIRRAREVRGQFGGPGVFGTSPRLRSVRPVLRRGCPSGLEADREKAGRVRPRLGEDLGQGRVRIGDPDANKSGGLGSEIALRDARCLAF